MLGSYMEQKLYVIKKLPLMAEDLQQAHGDCSLASPYGHWYSSVGKCRFCCELIVHVPEPAGTGTDPTTSIVGAQKSLTGWRLCAQRRSDSECII